MNHHPHPVSPLLALVAGCAALAAAAGASAQPSLDGQPIGWVAPMDFSTYNLASGSAVAFRGDFIRATWDGDLVAHNVASNGGTSVRWRAREKVPAHGSRIIFTSTASGTGAAFRWSGASSISAAQKTALGGDSTGPALLNYLRGDKSNERSDNAPTLPYRQRWSALGAIIHSRPYVDGDTVYVGANDGMLHAFDTATGVERWAYVPGQLYAGNRLASVATPSTGLFPYTVNGSMAVGMVGSSKLLVGALGTGAKGLFALDITSAKPSNEAVAAGMARWEINDASSGYGNLGHIVSSPQIVKLNTGDTAVLVSNGIGSTNGTSTLFVIRASDGVRLAEISAGSGGSNALGGLAAVDRDGNGTVDVVYAGDAAGTMWKFDFSGTALPSTATALHTPPVGERRPITAAPSVTQHPRGGLMVNWGTGQLRSDADLSSTTDEYLYGYWDSSSASGSTLVAQTLTGRTVGAQQVRTVSANAVNFAGSARGWRITLSGGERLIGGDTLTDSGRYVVTTAVPAGAGQGAWLLQVDAYTGGAPAAPFFDLNGDAKISSTDNSDRVQVTVAGASRWDVPVGKLIGAGIWSQPVLAQFSSTLDLPYLNYNANVALPSTVTTVTVTPPPATESGVYGGHFDFDIFYRCSSSKSISKDNCSGQKHVHEYDDKYNVVGVNMTAASEREFNLSNAISSTTTPSFKILVANARWSPAATLTVGSNIAGQAWRLPLSPEGFLAATPGGPAVTFTRQSLGSQFIFALPVTAFSSKNWGTGEERAGLIPTQTGCVQKNVAPNLAFMDGAFTVQVVDASTDASHVMAVTVPGGSPHSNPGGFRLRDDSAARGKLLAQYTAFWHHGNKHCVTSSASAYNNSWTRTPSPDFAGKGKGSTPSGSLDPTGAFASGYFTGDAALGTGGTTTTITFNGVEVRVNRSFDGDGLRQVLTRADNGAVMSDVRSSFGTDRKADLQLGQRARTGRLGWKEIVR